MIKEIKKIIFSLEEYPERHSLVKMELDIR